MNRFEKAGSNCCLLRVVHWPEEQHGVLKKFIKKAEQRATNNEQRFRLSTAN
jgi:hypothetical protein